MVYYKSTFYANFQGSGIGGSTVMNGMVFKRVAEGEVKLKSEAKIAVFTCPFDITQTETKVCFLLL